MGKRLRASMWALKRHNYPHANKPAGTRVQGWVGGALSDSVSTEKAEAGDLFPRGRWCVSAAGLAGRSKRELLRLGQPTDPATDPARLPEC